MRQSLKVAQRRQKDAYDKGVRHMVFQTGDLVLRYTPQLKPGVANKFHRQWEGPFEIEERVTGVTYRLKKVRGHSRRSQVVHFNNLRLYQRRQEERIEEPAAGESVDAPQGGSEECEQVPPACGEVESTDPDTVTGGAEEEFIGVAARVELFDEVVDVPDESEYRSCFADTVSVGEIEQDGGHDQVVDMLATEGSGLLEDVKNGHISGEEKREHEQEAEEEQLAGHSQRPVRIRNPPDRYGKWILNSLQQISDRLKMLEDKERMDKERTKKLKPKLLKKARTLRHL